MALTWWDNNELLNTASFVPAVFKEGLADRACDCLSFIHKYCVTVFFNWRCRCLLETEVEIRSPVAHSKWTLDNLIDISCIVKQSMHQLLISQLLCVIRSCLNQKTRTRGEALSFTRSSINHLKTLHTSRLPPLTYSCTTLRDKP